MLERNAACALPATAANRKRSGVTFLPEAVGCFPWFPFEFRRGPLLEYKICAHHQFVGGRDGPSTFWNHCCRGAQHAVRRSVLQRIIGPRAGDLFAGTGALRHAASLPEAIRGLHGNRLLDGNAGAKVRIREALSGRRPPTEVPLRASACFPRGLLS